MFKALMVVCAAGVAQGVIVRDPVDEYNYSYPATGDSKRLWEPRHVDLVSGHYTVLDPDGTQRFVHYTTDPRNGFKEVLVQDSDTFSHHPLRLFSFKKINQEQYYTTSRIVPNPQQYFTPAHELVPDKTHSSGLYFEPNHKYA